MDNNKLEKLREIGYEISTTCALCKYSLFPNNDWGYCEKFTYNHLKHNEDIHKLSIHKLGTCPDFERSESKVQGMLHYMEFFEGE